MKVPEKLLQYVADKVSSVHANIAMGNHLQAVCDMIEAEIGECPILAKW